jgi:1-deoxy-D-xylulose-5-phosphate reductoisomerase
MLRNLVILGSTGSIGRQTLDVARRLGERISVYGLATNRNVQLLEAQAAEFHPRVVAANVPLVGANFGGAEVMQGEDGVVELVRRPEVDLVVVGSAGSGGLLPTLAALRAGKLVALANKETLVMAGPVIRQELEMGHGQLVPIDSEHSAIWQCLQGEPRRSVERLTLTASGGALRNLSPGELEGVTPEQALHHPTWNMGRKITVDCANLMNKGLEAIEAHWLFNIPMDRIDIVVHHQSIIHSLVTFDDSSTKAQLGLPNMRLPIQYALSHPERWPNALPRLDLAAAGTLTFEPIDLERYPALRLALDAGRAGGTYPAVLAAADDVAVGAFLERAISFTRIPAIIETVLQEHTPCHFPSLDDILGADAWGRSVATQLVSRVNARLPHG